MYFRSELTEGSECKNASRFTIVACAVCTRTRCNYDASVPLLCVLIVPSPLSFFVHGTPLALQFPLI